MPIILYIQSNIHILCPACPSRGQQTTFRKSQNQHGAVFALYLHLVCSVPYAVGSDCSVSTSGSIFPGFTNCHEIVLCQHCCVLLHAHKMHFCTLQSAVSRAHTVMACLSVHVTSRTKPQAALTIPVCLRGCTFLSSHLSSRLQGPLCFLFWISMSINQQPHLQR